MPLEKDVERSHEMKRALDEYEQFIELIISAFIYPSIHPFPHFVLPSEGNLTPPNELSYQMPPYPPQPVRTETHPFCDANAILPCSPRVHPYTCVTCKTQHQGKKETVRKVT